MNNKKLILAIIVSVIVIVAIATVAIVLSGNNSNDSTAHTHSYGEWETVKEATCSTEGILERYCDCGENQVRPITAKGHSYGEWTVTKEATETNQGVETRYCNCGASETKSIPIKEPQIQTKQLSLLEFCNELETYHEATKNQQSFSYVISDIYGDDSRIYCTIYFDGEQTMVQYNPGETHILGKVGSEYVEINVDEKTYTVMSESEFNDCVNSYRRNMLMEVEYFDDEVKKGTNFACEKLTNGNKITYFVTFSVEYGVGTVNYRTTIEVVDGVIVKYEDPVMYEEIYTYPNDIVVEIPDISDFTRQ